MPKDNGSGPSALGRYRLHGEIVSGGMGVVRFGSICEDGQNRVVAIKQLSPSLVSDPELVDAFVREAGLAVRIHHPNVVPTIEVGVHEGEVFVVMEYLHGESLARVMRSGAGAVPPAIASRIGVDVLRGLSAVHDVRDDRGNPLGVVHRDISPHNILVCEDGTSYVIDFGIAKVAGDGGNTQPGFVKGKLSYMSPEQIKAGEVTPSTDLFSAAVVLWELLAGVRLFASGSVGSLMRRIAQGRIKAPSVHVQISPELDALVLRGLSSEPAGRFESASVFADELEKLVPPAPREQVAAWVKERVGSVLQERAQVVRGIEQQGLPTRSQPPRKRRPLNMRVMLAVAAVASALGILAGVALFAGSRRADESISSAPSSEVVLGTTHSALIVPPTSADPSGSAALPPPGFRYEDGGRSVNE